MIIVYTYVLSPTVGDDEGRVLGALITGDAEKSVAGSEVQTQSKGQQRRRKRYRG